MSAVQATAAAGTPQPVPTLRVADAGQLQAVLPDVPTLLLSASVPYPLEASKLDPADVSRLQQWTRQYVDTARPQRIRTAVSALTRVALNHGLRLVFGAHPSISPMVLQVARDMDAPPGSILIFQSEAYAALIPTPTWELASWKSGLMVQTPAQPELPHNRRHPNSLRLMRELMARVPGVRAAVFVGGMQGVVDEADLFHAAHPQAKRYAVASTGSAALVLADRDPAAFHGTLGDPTVLRDNLSYSVVARRIVLDLPPPGTGRP